jgi:hypothetical protein
VFEAIKTNWFDRLANKGEDFSFSHRAQDAGFQPWFTSDHQCDHIHSGSLRELLHHSIRLDSVGTELPGADAAP